MKKDNKKENKYFYVFDIEDAERIRDLTDEVYYKFADRYTGNTFYSFRKTREVVAAYKLIMNYKAKIERSFK